MSFFLASFGCNADAPISSFLSIGYHSQHWEADVTEFGFH